MEKAIAMTTEQDVAALAAVIRAVDGKSYREEREKELQELRKRRLAVKLLREGFEKALLELSQEDEATRIELLSQRKLELTRLREAGLTSARKGDLAHAATEADLHAEEEKIRIELLRLEALQRKAKEEEEAKRKKEEEAKLKKARDDEKAKHQKKEEEKKYIEAHVEDDLKQNNTNQEQQEIENYLELDDSAGVDIISPTDITTNNEQLHIVNTTPEEQCYTPNDAQSIDPSNETDLFSTDNHQVEENLVIDMDGEASPNKEPEFESMEILHLKQPTEASTPPILDEEISNFGSINHEKELSAEAEGNEKLEDEVNEKNLTINAEVNGAMTNDSQNITENDEAHLLLPSATDNLNSLKAVENNDATDRATEIAKLEVDEKLDVTSCESTRTDSLTQLSSVLSIPGSISHVKELQSSLPNDSKLTQTKEVLHYPAALDSAVFTWVDVEEKDGTDIDIIAAEDGLVTEGEPVSIIQPEVVETSLPINNADKASDDEILSSMFNKEVKSNDKNAAEDSEQHEPITSGSIGINHEEAIIEEMDHFPSNITQSTILAASSTDMLEEKVDGAMLTEDDQSSMNSKDLIPTIEQQPAREHAPQSVAAEESHENAALVHSVIVSLKDKEQIAVVASDEADVAIGEEVPYDSPSKCCKTVNTDPSVSPTINNNSEDTAAATNTAADMDVQYQEESSQQVKLTAVADDVFSPSKVLVGKKLDVELHSAVDSISCEISPSGNMGGSPERLHATGKSNPVPHYARFRTIGRNSYDRAYYLETKEKEETS